MVSFLLDFSKPLLTCKEVHVRPGLWKISGEGERQDKAWYSDGAVSWNQSERGGEPLPAVHSESVYTCTLTCTSWAFSVIIPLINFHSHLVTLEMSHVFSFFSKGPQYTQMKSDSVAT